MCGKGKDQTTHSLLQNPLWIGNNQESNWSKKNREEEWRIEVKMAENMRLTLIGEVRQ